MYYSKIYSPGSGLTNQIFSLVTSIIIALYNKESIIVVDQFLDDFSKDSSSPISTILDMEETNKLLYSHYGVMLIDRHNIDRKLVSNDIIVDINKNTEYKHTFAWINDINKELFEHILMNIRFHKDFVEKSIHFKEKNNCNNGKTNVIHLRVENDAIKHWSKMNNMTEQNFKAYIENKYIDLIKKYIDKNDQTIILSSTFDNAVIDFLLNNGYSYLFTEKHFEGREKNAITDLLISESCNNIFIGNFNPLKLNGSSFSYFISKTLPEHVKQIMIDLDRIYDNEISNK
jgi:hypothetical protein